MRALHYRLENGTIVKTLAEAKASGQKYTPFMEIIAKPFTDTPQQAHIRQHRFGIL